MNPVQSLKTMISMAREKNMFLYCQYQDLWFSPDELEEHNARGCFRWEAANWKLKDPNERTKQLKQRIENSERELKKWIAKITGKGTENDSNN